MSGRRHQPFKIGVTGSCGAGKSAVLNILRREGATVLDLGDAGLKLLMDNPQRLSIKLSDYFGGEITDPAGRMSRKTLVALLYQFPQKKVIIEQKLDPFLRTEAKRFLYHSIGAGIRAVECARLLENDTQHLYDEIWTVTAEFSLQVARLRQRENLAGFQAEYLINTDWSSAQKAALSHRVIDNSGDLHQTELQVKKALDEIRYRKFKVSL